MARYLYRAKNCEKKIRADILNPLRGDKHIIDEIIKHIWIYRGEYS